MGDRAYTRFSFPVHLLTPEATESICDTFGLAKKDIEVFEGPPDPSDAGYDNGTALRLVNGCPCLVIEDDQANYGGYAEEESLVKAKIPYLRENHVGGNYGPSRTVFDGLESMTIPLDHEGNPIVGASICPTGSVDIDDDAVKDLRLFATMAHRLLKVP